MKKEQKTKRIPYNFFRTNTSLQNNYGIDHIEFYGYFDNLERLIIVGQIFVNKPIEKDFCLICTVYDNDDDVLESTESRGYGSGLVTSMIKSNCFFNGFPFKFYISNIKMENLKKIYIYPSDNY